MEALLAVGADVNAQSLGQQTSPLMAAIDSGNEQALDLILSCKGVDLEAVNFEGNTALLIAARTGRVDIVKKLMGRGANFDVRNTLGQTPLAIAAANGRHAAIKDLYRLDPAQLDVCDNYRYSPLMFACVSTAPNETVDALLDMAPRREALVNGSPGLDGMTPMLWAAKRGEVRLVETFGALGAYGLARTTEGQTAMSLAAQFGHLDTLKAMHRLHPGLIEIRDDFNYTPLMHALFNNRNDAAKTLLELGALQQHSSVGEFQRAISNPERANVVSGGMIYVGNLYAGQTPLMIAATGGNVDAARMLLARSSDVNDRSQGDHRTALMMASHFGHQAMVDELLAHPGIDVNQKAQDGRTSLMIAAENGHVELAKKLIAAGADLKAKDAQGKTAQQLVWDTPHRKAFGKLLVPDSLRAKAAYRSNKMGSKVSRAFDISKASTLFGLMKKKS